MKLLAVAMLMGMMTAQGAVGPLETEVDLWRFGATQGGLFIALMIVLWFYRRDFLIRSETEANDRVQLRLVIEKNTIATTNQAVEAARTIDAMHRFSRGIEALEKQQMISEAVAKRTTRSTETDGG